MSITNENPALPRQDTGAASDTEATADFDSTAAAQAFFSVVKNRLLNVNSWQQWAGAGTATFQLTDAAGNEVDRLVQEGDHFKIDIPGPGPLTGDGFDWVQVQQICETTSPVGAQILLQVRPATNPTNDRSDVAHFFTDAATSNFVVKWEGKTVAAAVHGRNEKPNTSAETLVDKARNAAVASGAAVVFAKLQWKSLVTGLVKKEA